MSTLLQSEISQSPGRPGLTVDGTPKVNVALYGYNYRAVVPIADDILGDNEILEHQSKQFSEYIK